MSTEDFIGHIAYLWLIVGTIMVAYKKKMGWLARFIGELLWVWIGFEMHMSSIWLWGLVFLFLDGFGFYNWLGTSNDQNQNAKC